MTSKGRVLSIQSHVAYGYVGNKAAVPTLQCLGYDVDAVNTVNFSNHSAYRNRGGFVTSPEDLLDIFRGLEENGLLHPTRLLTGYTPSANALQKVADLVRKLKRDNPDLIYLLDPVMGDAGILYVAEDVVPAYRSMLHLATIITPNWFEVETLTGIKLTSLASLRDALQTLHETYNIPNVVISSIPIKPWLLSILPPSLLPPSTSTPTPDYLLCLSSTNSPRAVHAHCIPLIPGFYAGVGDLFSALTLGHYSPSTPHPLANAVSHALSKTHAILRSTYAHARALPEEERPDTDDEEDAADPKRRRKRMRGRELRIVQGFDVLRGEGVGVEERRMVIWEDFWGVAAS